MSQARALATASLLFLMATSLPAAGQSVSLFLEDFESLRPDLGSIVTFDSELRSEPVTLNTDVWSPDAPADWNNDRSNVPTVGNANSGVTEFEGWTFVDREWWIATAGDQQRSNFIGSQGVIAVADPDEWDDFGTPDPSDLGLFDAKLTTPAIDLTAAAGEDISVFFNSSWRPEVDQKATLTATYNDGANTQVELLRYESQSTLPDSEDPNPFFQPDSPNDNVLISLTGANAVPAGATSVELEFRLFDAGNNWWWAFDNLQVFTGNAPPSSGQLRTVIDRDTGEVTVINDTGSAVDLRGYSIRSNNGVFDEAAANFLSPANGWLQATNIGDEANDLSEINLNSAVLADGESIDLGAVWNQFYIDEGDVSFEYLVVGNDEPVPGLIEFTGNGDESFQEFDLNYDGVIDVLDWIDFKAGFGRPLDGLTNAQLYNTSDLNQDGSHTATDFQIFKGAFEAANGAGSFALIASVPEPGSLGLMAIAAVGFAARRRIARVAPLLALAMVAMFGLKAEAQLKLFEENFDGLPLLDSLEESPSGSNVVTRIPPAGWAIDNSGIPIGPQRNADGEFLDVDGNVVATEAEAAVADGVVDWLGWSFSDRAYWVSIAGQGRSEFTRASGNIMVADSDEWDDLPNLVDQPSRAPDEPDNTGNFYDTFITTPQISIPNGVPAGRLQLSFDSSWRAEFDDPANQSAAVKVFYDGATEPIEILNWESNPEGDNFKADATNERIVLDLEYDGVASELSLQFDYTEADNDWWWAIDNLLVSVPSNPLKLRVNTFNGEAFLEGDDTIETAINFFAVESENGILTGTQASGLAGAGLPGADGPDNGSSAGDTAGEQWESLTFAGTADSLFAEAFLHGETIFDDQISIALGRLMDPSTAEGDRDITFSYALDTGDIIEIAAENVEYFFDDSVQLPGDANGDGAVDLLDLDILGSNFGTTSGGTVATGDFNGDGAVDLLDLDILGSNFGTTSGATAVPEPAGLALVGLAVAGLLASRRRAAGMSLVAIAVLAFVGADASAFTLDRNYEFGDNPREMASAGIRVGTNVPGTIDSEGSLTPAGQPSLRQVINMAGFGPNAFAQPTYVDVSDRPDGGGQLGVALNAAPDGSTFNRQYMRTGFTEALNYPERSPTSTFAVPQGSINYDIISDRGFQLWTKPTFIRESHIVMDTNQHGVLINADGEFAMRYAFNNNTIQQQAALAGQPASDFADLFDYASGVQAEVDTWYHLSVVRPFGPSRGSILFIDGVAQAAALGEYFTEEVVNDDFGQPDLSEFDVSPLVVGANTGNPAAAEGNPAFMTATAGTDMFYSGVVDDLEMFIMGINEDNLFGEYVFERDNGYAKVFKPTVAGDVDGNGTVNLDDAQSFADNWLFEKRLTWTDPNDSEQSLVVGDLESRGKGDFNYDGVVDLADWAVLNNASPSMARLAALAIAGHTIPEPSSCLLASVLAAAGFVAKRGNRGNQSA